MFRVDRQKYTAVAIWLHWIVGIAILAQLALGLFMVDIPKETPDRSWYFNLHKSIGVTLALFIAIRIGWRLAHRPPPLDRLIPPWQLVASKISHVVLYLGMIAMPLTGLIMSSYSKYGVKAWGLKIIDGSDDKVAREFWLELHELTADILMVVIAIHVIAALKHLMIEKNGVFQRMLPSSKNRNSRAIASAVLPRLSFRLMSAFASMRTRAVSTSPCPATHINALRSL
jgi:cytochrome b561